MAQSNESLLKDYFRVLSQPINKRSGDEMRALGTEIEARAKAGDEGIVKMLIGYINNEGYSIHHYFFARCLAQSPSKAAEAEVLRILENELFTPSYPTATPRLYPTILEAVSNSAGEGMLAQLKGLSTRVEQKGGYNKDVHARLNVAITAIGERLARAEQEKKSLAAVPR